MRNRVVWTPEEWAKFKSAVDVIINFGGAEGIRIAEGVVFHATPDLRDLFDRAQKQSLEMSRWRSLPTANLTTIWAQLLRMQAEEKAQERVKARLPTRQLLALNIAQPPQGSPQTPAQDMKKEWAQEVLVKVREENLTLRGEVLSCRNEIAGLRRVVEELMKELGVSFAPPATDSNTASTTVVEMAAVSDRRVPVIEQPHRPRILVYGAMPSQGQALQRKLKDQVLVEATKDMHRVGNNYVLVVALIRFTAADARHELRKKFGKNYIEAKGTNLTDLVSNYLALP